MRPKQQHDVLLRQSYVRVAKRAALMAGRYAHAKQYKRHNRELRFLRTRLGRLIRDIRRKTADDAALHGNPYDGHTLGPVVAEMEKLTGVEVRRIHVDKGYRGHSYANTFRV
jgi:hypothetical protein